MRRSGQVEGRRTARIAAALVLAAVLLAACTDTEESATTSTVGVSSSTASPTSTTTTTLAPTTTTTVVDEARILLAWTSGGLPAGFSEATAARPEVERVTAVRGGQADLLASSLADGTAVDAAPAGWAYPLDTVAIDPASYASFTNDPDDRALIESLTPGRALLPASSAELRGVGVGGALELRGATLEIAGVVSDRSGSEAELVIHVADAERVGVATERFLLAVHDPTRRASLDRALADLAGSNPVHLRTTADTTRLRHGDSVVPIVHVKRAFGEFAYRDVSGREVEVDPAWVAAHIVSADVPILGSVRCHRSMIEPLQSALSQLESEGLAHVVDPAAFSGCWNARRMLPGAPLSKHAWGLAVDINVDGDPRGTFETQHPRFTELMREAGYAWGGDWLVADPAHYELDP